MINSGTFNGMNSRDAIKEITAYLEEKGLGKAAVNYRLRDWLISRQRYWGTPIPMLYCENVVGYRKRLKTFQHFFLQTLNLRGKGSRRLSQARALRRRSVRSAAEKPLVRQIRWTRFWTLRGTISDILMLKTRMRSGTRKGQILDACRPVHRRGRACDTSPALCAVLQQIPL